jgi:hypothetical protein
MKRNRRAATKKAKVGTPRTAPASIEHTISVPEAGKRYYDLSKNPSYAAAEAGLIPYIQVGRLKRVPVVAMERKIAEGR